MPFWGGLLAAIPFAMLTGLPRLGALLVRSGLCAVPEDTAPPPALAALHLPALAHRQRGAIKVVTSEPVRVES
jgi:membrane glycosyltransferase